MRKDAQCRFAAIHKKAQAVHSNKRKHEQTTNTKNNSNNNKGNKFINNGTSNNSNKNDVNANKHPKLDGEYNQKNGVPNKPAKSTGSISRDNTVKEKGAKQQKQQAKGPQVGKKTVQQKGTSKTKAPQPLSTTTKFFELLEKDGILNGGEGLGYAEANEERELKSLRKKLGIKGNKLSGDFAADDLLSGIGSGESDGEEVPASYHGEDSDDGSSEGDDMEDMEGAREGKGKPYQRGYGLSDSEEDDEEELDLYGDGEDASEGEDSDGGDGESDDAEVDGDEMEAAGGESQSEDENEGKYVKVSTQEYLSRKSRNSKRVSKCINTITFTLSQLGDIYGRLRNVATGEIVQQPKPGVYVPPMARQSNASVQLTRQVKGLFNKLSPTNIHSVVVELEKVFQQNSKNEMASILTNCIMSSCLGDARGIASLAVASISVLSCIIDLFGTEIGGQFLEALAKRFDESYKAKKDRDVGNAVLLFIHIYNFGLVHCVLIYDLIKMFIANFTELDVELILTTIQNAGSALRKDDPGSLKEIVVRVLERAKEKEQAADPHFSTARMKFMVEAITDLKNNKTKPPPTAELIPQMKRAHRSIVGKRGGKGGELKVTFDELINAETRGRWWVVGSAWAGAQAKNIPTPSPSVVSLENSQLGITVDLLELATKQKMNTDLRKAVFCILMSSEDYLDAVSKLVVLGLKSKTKDMVHVLMHCCQQEKKFNRFYAQVAANLSSQNNEFKFSLQIGFYQKLKLLEENKLKERATANIAFFLSCVVGELALSILTLKAIALTSMTPQQARFLDIFFVYLFTQFDEKRIYEVFKRLVVVEEAEADRVSKDLILYFDRMLEDLLYCKDIKEAIETYKEATTGKPATIDKTLLTKKMNLAIKVLKMPLE